MIYSFDDFVLDIERRELRQNGMLRTLEPQVFNLLRYLIENRHRVVTRDEIFKAVWHGRLVSDAVLSSRLSSLRKATRDTGVESRIIRTVRGSGIRFVALIRERDDRAESESVVPGVRRLAFTWKEAPTLAFLPFRTGDNDRETKLFAEALTQETMANLHHLDWLFVASRPFLNSTTAVEADMRYVLEASVRWGDQAAQVSVHLYDNACGHLLWVKRCESATRDLAIAAKALAVAITAGVGDHVFAAESIRSKFKTPDGRGIWDCVVRALSLINTRKKVDIQAAEDLLQRALKIDSGCAAVHALLSFVQTLKVHLGWVSRLEAQPVAFSLALAALEANDEEPWGHVALGYATLQLRNEPEEAIWHLQRALELNPHLSIPHYLIALASTYSHDIRSAFDHADKTEDLRSVDLLAMGNAGAHNNVRATASFVAGHYDNGVRFARRVLIESPRQVPAYRQIVTNAALAGRIEEAGSALRSIRRVAPNIEQWVKESATTWSRKEDYQRYVEAFKLAGLRNAPI